MKNFKRIEVLYCVCLLVLDATASIFTPVVKISQGKLRGLRSISGQNRYYGIPYAQSQRFQNPKEPSKWKGTYMAVNLYEVCAQSISFINIGVEDCLRLDVYTPESAKPGDRLPVLVFIHGGAYYYGARAHYDPEFLVTKKTVAVIVNYRVGVLGFLCLNGVSNIGLRDIVAALQWTKENIAAFGGDPDNVTLTGQSSGASAAAMLLLVESARNLFHKMILMSGTPMASWAFNFENKLPAYSDAKKIGAVVTDEDVFNMFSNASVDELLTSTRDVSSNPKHFKYTPCMDKDSDDPLFTDTPYNLITSGNFMKVPTMLGYASVEGILFYGINDDQTFKEWDLEFEDRLPSIFSWCSDNDKRKIASKLRRYYFGENKISSKLVNEVVRFYSDWMAYSHADDFSELIMRHSDQPIFKYIFSYEGDRNFAKSFFGWRTNISGATHTDDIFYMFKPAGIPLLLNNKDKYFIDRYTTMITNFMKYGDPTPAPTKLLPLRWAPATANNSRSLRLDSTMSMTSHTLKSHFFSEMLCNYGQKGFVPCKSREMCTPRMTEQMSNS